MLKDLLVFITQLNFEFLENFQLQNDKTSLSYISQIFFATINSYSSYFISGFEAENK